jgi:subtilisin family serine protease
MRCVPAPLSPLVLATLAACLADPVAPVAPAVPPALAVNSSTPASPGRHVVLMRANDIPADFAERVRALGARVEFAHDGAGFAVLGGLTAEGADLVGLVDLTRSRSFVPHDDSLVAALFPGRHPVTDLHSHGTHVASTVASNAIMAAGVTSRTTLIAVKVLDRTNTGPTSGILRGVLYAVEQGADVVNISIIGLDVKSSTPGVAHYYNRIFNYAFRKGVVVVVGAGNSGIDMDRAGEVYAAYCDAPNVICVSATGPTSGGLNGPWPDPDAFASYSNYGRSAVSVAAPGGTILGAWVLGACSQTTLDPLLVPCAIQPRLLNNWGTSMATPHVSGLAALLVAEIGRGNPAQVRSRILQSAEDLGQPGTDPFYGRGRINVARALGL